MIVNHRKTLRFSQKAWQQMWALTAACDVEISAMGIVAEGEPNLVEEFFVVKQKCSATRTEMDPDALMELTMALREKGINQNRMRVWWHSHVKMDTEFSGTDEDNIERYASTYLWSVVTQKQDADRVAYGFAPLKLNIRCDTFDPNDTKDHLSPLRYTHEKCAYGVSELDIVGDEWAKGEVSGKITKTYQSSYSTKSSYSAGGNTSSNYPDYGKGSGWDINKDQDWDRGLRKWVPRTKASVGTAAASATTNRASNVLVSSSGGKKANPKRTALTPTEKVNFPTPVIHNLYSLGLIGRGEALHYEARVSSGTYKTTEALCLILKDRLGDIFENDDDQKLCNDLIEGALAAYRLGAGSTAGEKPSEEELTEQEARKAVAAGLMNKEIQVLFIEGIIGEDEANLYDTAVSNGGLTIEGVKHAIDSGEGWDGTAQGAN
jgi:hypothetical protein